MTSKSIITNWTDAKRALFSNQPMVMQHRLAESGLFTEETLAEVIDKIPASNYHLHTMGYDYENPEWQEGVLGGVPVSRLEPGKLELENLLVVAATELTSNDDIAAYAAALKEVI